MPGLGGLTQIRMWGVPGFPGDYTATGALKDPPGLRVADPISHGGLSAAGIPALDRPSEWSKFKF